VPLGGAGLVDVGKKVDRALDSGFGGGVGGGDAGVFARDSFIVFVQINWQERETREFWWC